MFVSLSAYRSRRPDRRLPRGLPFRSWDGPQPLPCRKVLLVEHRDEVFARLAWDLADAGLQVRRVTCAAEASRECARFKPDVLAANVDLPDGSGWLLTAKQRLVSATPPIWLYAPWPSADDAAMAKFVGADGKTTTAVTAPRLKMADVMGRSLMIHAGGDNYSDQPAPLGGGGARVACGVIK